EDSAVYFCANYGSP
nr:immunoglobulin heavy chain junction region [Mus musculus]